MVRYYNECCGCATPGYPCMGKACPMRKVPHCFCDKCGSEIDLNNVYHKDDLDLCADCYGEDEENEDN